MRISDWSSVVCSSDLVQLQVDGDAVAAQRIVAVRLARRVFRVAEVPRLPAMIQDHFLVQLAQVVEHQPNNSDTAFNASARASTSEIGRASCRERVCQNV